MLAAAAVTQDPRTKLTRAGPRSTSISGCPTITRMERSYSGRRSPSRSCQCRPESNSRRRFHQAPRFALLSSDTNRAASDLGTTDGAPLLCAIGSCCLGPNTAGDDIKPEQMRAFLVPRGKGVYFHPGTWHNGVYVAPEHCPARFLTRQGRVHARVSASWYGHASSFVHGPSPSALVHVLRGTPRWQGCRVWYFAQDRLGPSAIVKGILCNGIPPN